MQFPANMRWEYSVPTDSYVEGAISRFVKAMGGISVGGVDDDAMASSLERESCIEDQTFGAADP